jgi:predicted ATPase
MLTGCGKLAEGLALARKGFADHVAVGSTINHTCYLALIAESHAGAGEAAEARTLLAAAVEHAERTGERWFAAELHRLTGEWIMAHRPEDKEAAEACFRLALPLAQEQNAKWWELRAATSLARLWRDHGKQSEARTLLEPIYGWFTEGFDTPDLRDARALLDALA